MASPNVFPSGLALAGTTFDGGPNVAQYTGCYFSGGIQWLDTVNGNDASSGAVPQLPVKTLAQAHANVAANGLIVISRGSAESIASQTFNKAFLTVLGMGTGSVRPRYTAGYPATDMFDVTAAGVRFHNIYFPASTAVPDARVRFGAAEGGLRDCYFESGANDTSGAAVIVHTSANSCRIRDTYFAVTASRPNTGLLVDSAVTDTSVEGCTFDGGSFGWSSDAFKIVAAATRTRIENTRLIRQANFNTTVTASSYQAFGLIPDGSSYILFTA